MTTAKMYIQVRCPECGLVLMNNEDETMQCTFSWCGQYGIRYKIPVIQLVLAESKMVAPSVAEICETRGTSWIGIAMQHANCSVKPFPAHGRGMKHNEMLKQEDRDAIPTP